MEQSISFYQMAVNNMATYIKESNPLAEGTISIFDLSLAASIIFCKAKEEIIIDIVNVK